jgi:hypothetical protein
MIKQGNFTYIYLPFIVTTAQLKVYPFNPQDIPLEKGIMESGDFEPLPFIRFRKSLTIRSSPGFSPTTLKESNKDKERTIFVVNASALVDILRRLDPD